MSKPQTFKNHARFSPPFHFVLVPILLLNLIFSIYDTVHRYPAHKYLFHWWIVMSLALLLMAALGRMQAMKAQDRIIRLEERLRLATLLPPNEQSHIGEFTTGQLIALRFASDAELPALARRTLTQNLEPKAIKQAIENWRADNLRV
jgi:chromate transport protein ChrA